MSELVAIVGPARSGKTEASSYLESEHGYSIIRSSDVLRQSLERETGRTEFSREELRLKGVDVRRRIGPDFAVQYALEQLNNGAKRVLVDGIRNRIAVNRVQELGGVLIGMTADARVRYERDKRADDGKSHYGSLEEMIADEAKEMISTTKFGIGVLEVMQLVDERNIIDTTLLDINEVQKRLDNVLGFN